MYGDELKKIREKRGMTRKQVEYASGVDRGTLARIESGKTKEPGAWVMLALAKLYGVSFEELAEVSTGKER